MYRAARAFIYIYIKFLLIILIYLRAPHTCRRNYAIISSQEKEKKVHSLHKVLRFLTFTLKRKRKRYNLLTNTRNLGFKYILYLNYTLTLFLFFYKRIKFLLGITNYTPTWYYNF